MAGVVDPAAIDVIGVEEPAETTRRRRSGRAGRRRRFPWLGIYALFAMLYLFLPIIWIVVFSFNDPGQKFNLLWKQFTLQNWAHPFRDSGLTDAFVKSLQVAVISVTIAVILGTLMALALARYRFRGSAAMDIFLVIPLTTPEVVMGASLLTLFLGWSVAQGFWTIVIAHIMFCVSFVALTVKARIGGFDWTLEDAAMDLGATPWRTFRKVTFPLILPGILAAALLSFALSIDDYIITSFNAGNTVTFPLWVYGASRVGVPPQVNVMGTLIFAGGVLLALLAAVVNRRKQA